jgi:subtilisin family serine protease
VLIEERYVDREILVKFAEGTDAASRTRILSSVGATMSTPLSELASDTVLVRLSGSKTVPQSIASLQTTQGVLVVEPNYVVESVATSNDPYVANGSLWGMYGDASTPANAFGSQAAEAWSAGYTGSKDVYVAVIDGGVDFSHADLAPNAWVNPFDPVDGVDNDGNGYIDDTNGWDFARNDRTVYDGDSDDSHGTHVAGTIGAVGGNSIGVAGVNWNVTLISAKFLSNGGSLDDAIEAIDYVTKLKIEHGLNIVATNNSWGGGGPSLLLRDAIRRAGDAGILFVAAAGNAGLDIDASPEYPSAYDCAASGTGTVRDWDCVLSVAALGSGGGLASFSNYGSTNVDLGAPGVAVVSTTPGQSYASYSGTSMAAPHVAGAVALCASINPGLTAAQIRSAIIDSTVSTPSLVNKTVTNGRLNAGAMAGLCGSSSTEMTGGPSDLQAEVVSSDSVRLTWTDSTTGDVRQIVQQATRSSGVCGTFSTVTTIGANLSSAIRGGLMPLTSYCFRVRAENGATPPLASEWSNVATSSQPAVDPAYVCTSVPFSWVDTSGGANWTLTDDSAISVNLGFSMSFLGTSLSNVFVGSNGILGFGSPVTSYSNTSVPSLVEPNGFAAAFWMDLDPSRSGSVRTMTLGSPPNRRFVTTWTDVPVWAPSTSAVSPASGVTFQSILHETTADITFQYLDTTTGDPTHDDGRSATVGIESPTGRAGTLVTYARGFVTENTALRCAVPGTGSFIDPNPVSIPITSLPAAKVSTAYAQRIPVLGGVAPFTWSIVGGSLPPGLALDANTGRLTGSTAVVGVTNPTIRITDARGSTADRAFAVGVASPVAITTASLPGATVGSKYSTSLSVSGAAAGKLAWSVVGGSLPSGLSLKNGTISGTPSSPGTSSFTIQVRDKLGFTGSTTLGITALAPTMHVSGVSLTKTARRTTSQATATVSIGNNAGRTVNGVQVTGQWSVNGSISGTSSVTAKSGKASLKSPAFSGPAGATLTFCVTAISGGGFVLTTPLPVCTSTTL